MDLIGPGFCNDIYDSAAGPSELRSISVGGDPKLLYDFIAELIRCAISPTSLGKEPIVVIPAIDQITRLITANAAESQISIRSGSEPARVLCNPRSEKRQIGVAASVQGKITDRMLIND